MVDGWRRAGRKVHSGAGAPSAVTDRLWTVRGRELDCCRSPVPGNPRCWCCVRVCQSPVLIPGSGGRRACSHLQEVARRMKVLYERVAGPTSTSMPPPWPARSPTRTGRRRLWRRWPRRWRRGRNETGAPRGIGGVRRRTVDNGAGAGVAGGTVGRQSAYQPVMEAAAGQTWLPGSQVPSGRREATPNMVGGEKFTVPTVRVPHWVMQVTTHFPNWRMRRLVAADLVPERAGQPV